MAAGCAIEGGCPTDYVAISISSLSFLLLLSWSYLPFIVHKVPRSKGSSFWLPAIQVLASFNFLLSIVMSGNFLKFKRHHWWQSCYLWAGWIEGPFGFGLLLSCRLVQSFHLYCIFVRRRLPRIRSYAILPSILLPWVVVATLIQLRKPLNHHCHMKNRWIIPIVSFHGLYVVGLIAFTRAIHHVEFRFHELKDLWRGILVSASSIVIWVIAYALNEIHEEITWLQVASRFLLLLMASIFILGFFSISISQPLLSQMSLRKKERREFKTMGQVLGVPDSGLLRSMGSTLQISPNEPLDKLLQNRSFRQSFMEFADSCLAGESVHFYNEVHELDKIHVEDTIRRIYMARHIIEKFVVAGAVMEVNLSHRNRQEILTTTDLTDPNLFKSAVNELVQLMQMNLLKDYWSSMYFLKFKQEEDIRRVGFNLEQVNGWNFSPRLSSVRGSDNPFQIEVNYEEASHHEMRQNV